MAKGANDKTKQYWQEMIADMQEKIKGNKTISLENEDINELYAKTDIHIGTLNGYFGLDKSKAPANYPNESARSILAKEVLGFANWNEYLKSKQNQITIIQPETIEPQIIWTMQDLEYIKKELDKLTEQQLDALLVLLPKSVNDEVSYRDGALQKQTTILKHCNKDDKAIAQKTLEYLNLKK